MNTRVAKALAELVEVVAQLRGPNGCPWDRAQTHRSLVPYLLEEAYELAAAVSDGNPAAIEEELGDVLLQVLLHAQIEAEAGRFTIADVAETLKEKLIRRHPHVFGKEKVGTAEEVRAQWEELKKEEDRSAKRAEDRAKPALIRASKFLEVKEAQGQPIRFPRGRELPAGEPGKAIAEALLEIVALARKLGVDPELALHQFLEEHG
ncbi:MAG: MazG family protein [Candidatus Bipolaricaulota bacterium]|nr:MazG family protein [Candidatus Bipolaricaulota bacterium]MDW8126521.1 MazG family protein [Candidatus Bipolaricaulota bacterium]